MKPMDSSITASWPVSDSLQPSLLQSMLQLAGKRLKQLLNIRTQRHNTFAISPAARQVARENLRLQLEIRKLREVVQKERDYTQMLIQVNTATQQLLSMTDRKILLKSVTTALCEELDFTSAVLWVVDEESNRLVPISWSNVALEQLKSFQADLTLKPYSELLNHKKSYFIVDDVEDPTSIDSAQFQHIHNLSTILESQAMYLIPIVSVADAAERIERSSGETKTNAILMVGQRNRNRIIESKDILQRYAYAVGLTLGNVDTYSYLHTNYHSFKQQAITDGLTGLYNRRFFNEELSREVSRSYRHFLRMSLIMIDVDHFKKYNDQNGHQAGDEVLQRVAAILRNETRICDMECRYGGEEFVLILPETSKEEALGLAEKLRRKIYETEFPHGYKQPSGRLTVSLGVATFPEDASDDKSLIEVADDGLYRAKENGRNCVATVERTPS